MFVQFWVIAILLEAQLISSARIYRLDSDATGSAFDPPPRTAALTHKKKPLNRGARLFDLPHLKYLMALPGCTQRTQGLIVVHSAPENHEKRRFIRETWGSAHLLEDTPLRVIFTLGAVTDRALQHQLQQENAIAGDMLQGNFIDAYKNLTYKHVMGLQWFHDHCPYAQVLIKLDDDRVLNTPLLLDYLRRQQEQEEADVFSGNAEHQSYDALLHAGEKFEPAEHLFRRPQNLIFCSKIANSQVIRSPLSKWYVTPEEYPANDYPTYCSGFAIIYSADVVSRLLLASRTTPYFWVDDVHVTGTLRQLINIGVTTFSGELFLVYHFEDILKQAAKKSDFQPEFLVAEGDNPFTNMFIIWQMALAQIYQKPTFN